MVLRRLQILNIKVCTRSNNAHFVLNNSIHRPRGTWTKAAKLISRVFRIYKSCMLQVELEFVKRKERHDVSGINHRHSNFGPPFFLIWSFRICFCLLLSDNLFVTMLYLWSRKLPTLPVHTCSPPVLSEVHVTRYLVLCACFVDRCLPFWSLCCLFLFDLRILITPLVSSNSSYTFTCLSSCCNV